MGAAVQGLVKSYNQVQVLRGVDLDVQDGEIHALLGANGAGKSTLIKCLIGAVPLDAGTITIGGEAVTFDTPKQAQQAGIRTVHQVPSLAVNLNAAENVLMGREPRVGPFLRRRQMRQTAQRWFDELGMDIDARSPLSDLSNAQLQMVEIVKALSADPRFLILDEPTAALTEAEQHELMARLRETRTRRLPVLYVTHRLSEVFDVADRVTVLHGGLVALSERVSDVTEGDLVEAIVSGGHGGQTSSSSASAPRRSAAPRSTASPSRPVLSVRDLTAPKLGPVSFDVQPGEVLGVYGLVGSGRTELLESLVGAELRVAGHLEVRGEGYRPKDPRDAARRGVALVPSDRLRKSVFPGLTALENALLPSLSDLASGPLRSRSREGRAFDDLAGELRLHPHRPEQEARRFSGGNQQKLVISRWVGQRRGEAVHLLLLDEPTEGVDVGARQDLYRILRRHAETGGSVVMTSSEPEELLQVADRVLVLSGGLVVADLTHDQLDVRTLTRSAHFSETDATT